MLKMRRAGSWLNKPNSSTFVNRHFYYSCIEALEGRHSFVFKSGVSLARACLFAGQTGQKIRRAQSAYISVTLNSVTFVTL
jgi:hypothetical protein